MGDRGEEVRIHGQTFPVLDRLRFGGRSLLVIERLGHFERPTFRAVERGLTQEVRCVQVLPYSRQTVARLRLLSKISRPQANLPSIVGSHRERDQVYLVTRWVDGSTLKEYLRQCRDGREPWPSALVAINLVLGLAYGFRLLHDRLGVIHGDLHPSNLVLCRHTKRLVPIDYGNALNVERSAFNETGDGAVRAYAAPEVFEDRLCFQSDQFSAMAVCYQLLTGETPYDGLGGRVAAANRRGDVDAPISLSPASANLRHPAMLPNSGSAKLDAVLSRGLSLAVCDRFDTTSVLIDALNEVRHSLSGEQGETSSANRWMLRRVTQLGEWFGFS